MSMLRRRRTRNRWVAPYTDLARAMRVVTRTEATEFRPAGIVGLRPARPSRVVDLTRHRAAKLR
jgi:hypothetical protein